MYFVFVAGIPYEITVWTSNVRGAGTDSNVFIQMYGEGGKTEEYPLRNRTDNFEQGQTDKFKVMKLQTACTLLPNVIKQLQKSNTCKITKNVSQWRQLKFDF